MATPSNLVVWVRPADGAADAYTAYTLDAAGCIDVSSLASGAYHAMIPDFLSYDFVIDRALSLVTLRDRGIADNGADGVDVTDLYGDGKKSVLAGREDGTATWWEFTDPLSATEHTISSTPLGEKFDGGCWADPQGSGERIAVFTDQSAGDIYVSIPTDRTNYKGAWLPLDMIGNGYPNVQNVWAVDIDGDGQDELLVVYEGNTGSTGGVALFDYAGSGDLGDGANWTKTRIVEHPGAWWIILNADHIILSARSTGRNPGTVPGIFRYDFADPVTSVWTLSETIESSNEDWAQIDQGNFFGSGDLDIVAVIGANGNNQGDLYFYDHGNGWARSVYSVGGTQDTHYNAKVIPDFAAAGRDRLFVAGEGRFAQVAWNGSTWFVEREVTGTRRFKADDRVPFLAFGDQISAYLADSASDIEYIWPVNFNAPENDTFDPASLYQNGEAGPWFEIADLTTLKQNSDGTVDAIVESPVGFVGDKSGNGHHATSSVAINQRPTLRIDANGAHFLQFDGTEDVLAFANNIAGTGVKTIAMLASITHSPSSSIDALFSFGGSGAGANLKLTRETGVRVNSGNVLYNEPVVSDALTTVFVHVPDSASTGDVRVWLDGVEATQSSVNSQAINTGAGPGVLGEDPGGLHTALSVYALLVRDADSLADRTEIEAYLNALRNA